MVPATAQEALSTLAAVWSERPELVHAIRARWRAGSRIAGVVSAIGLPAELRAADRLAAALPAETVASVDVARLGEYFAQPAGGVLFDGCAASTWRRGTLVTRLLAIAAPPRGCIVTGWSRWRANASSKGRGSTRSRGTTVGDSSVSLISYRTPPVNAAREAHGQPNPLGSPAR
jgi:hypothetical protein